MMRDRDHKNSRFDTRLEESKINETHAISNIGKIVYTSSILIEI